MKKFLLLLLLNFSFGFDICVVGASSGLGKEIIYQSLQKNKKVLSFTNELMYRIRNSDFCASTYLTLAFWKSQFYNRTRNMISFEE